MTLTVVPASTNLVHTAVVLVSEEVHVRPSELTTAPAPVPASVIVSGYCDTLNVAVTARDAVSTSVHVGVPLHAPAKPVNCERAPAVALTVTEVPISNDSEQLTAAMLPGVLHRTTPFTDTVPAPDPVSVVVKST